MRRCEDEKMSYRPPLLEEPCAQTLSGNNALIQGATNEARSALCVAQASLLSGLQEAHLHWETIL